MCYFLYCIQLTRCLRQWPYMIIKYRLVSQVNVQNNLKRWYESINELINTKIYILEYVFNIKTLGCGILACKSSTWYSYYFVMINTTYICVEMCKNVIGSITTLQRRTNVFYISWCSLQNEPLSINDEQNHSLTSHFVNPMPVWVQVCLCVCVCVCEDFCECELRRT